MPLKTITGNTSHKRRAQSVSADSDSDASPPPMKKTSWSIATNAEESLARKTSSYSATELTNFSHDDLVAYALSLQKQLKTKPTTSSTSELPPQVSSLTIKGSRQESRPPAYFNGAPDPQINDLETLVQDRQCDLFLRIHRAVGASV
ncbi:MAG: hypothetical protein Q9181_008336 [Wetmoreana brouardii]